MVAPRLQQELGRVSALLADGGFQPAEPHSLDEAGLSEVLVDSLVCKQLAALGNASGRTLADHLCLPFGLLEPRYLKLRGRQLLLNRGSAPLNDFIYALTDQGREFAQQLLDACAYVGAAPVPLPDYVTSVEAQTIKAEACQREQLQAAFQDISVQPEILDRIGPAVNSGAGLFLYGAPGNGKTTLAERITLCFGKEIWLPRVLLCEGEIIKLFDPAYHKVVASTGSRILRAGVPRQPLDSRPPAHRHRRRRADPGQPGDPPQRPEQRQRSPLAAQEQRRLAAHRRLRKTAHQSGGTAQSLDCAPGKAL